MSLADVVGAVFTWAFAAGILRVTTPILLAALGGLISELAGVINIALEGTMLVAAFTGVVGSAYTQSAWIGMLAALVASLVFSALLAFFHIDLRADIILAGLAMNILASGGTIFVLYTLTGDKGSSSKLASLTMPYIDIPLLGEIPLIGPVINKQNVMVYVAFLLVPVVWALLYRTVLGQHIRAVGANPAAAATAGIDVRRVRYVALLLSGLLAGLGGIHMGMGYLQLFQRDMTAGRGFIALAAVYMGARHPVGTMAAALIFGAADALAAQLGSLKIPPQWVQMIPYAATVIALAVHAVAQRRAALRRQRSFQEQAGRGGWSA